MTRRTKVGFGIGLVLIGLVLVYNNGLAALVHSPLLHEYNLTDPLTIEVSSSAVVTDDVELLRGHYECYGEGAAVYWAVPTPDDVRVEGVATGSDAIFMGIAPADAVAGYLDGVAHDEITRWDCRQDDISEVVYATIDGAADPAAPGDQGFWVASVGGGGEQTLDWTIEDGDWTVVIMNADGSAGVSADVRFGVEAQSSLVPLGLGSLAVGLVAVIGGGRLLASVPSRPDATPRWTVRGRSVLPTTLEGRVAVLCAAVFSVPFMSGAMFGAPIFLFLGLRKGDRALLLLLPVLVSILPIGLIGIMIWAIIAG